MFARLGLCTLMLVSPLAAVVAYAADIPALVQKAKPAVVEIVTFDQQSKVLKTGTGFFISPDGLLLTNYHVISGGSSIMAKIPTGAAYFLKSIVTASEACDVAELQFVATDVPCLSLGSSSSGGRPTRACDRQPGGIGGHGVRRHHLSLPCESDHDPNHRTNFSMFKWFSRSRRVRQRDRHSNPSF
jgi:Trypsin-like peptidase domain